jgi:hypothetical protein
MELVYPFQSKTAVSILYRLILAAFFLVGVSPYKKFHRAKLLAASSTDSMG